MKNIHRTKPWLTWSLIFMFPMFFMCLLFTGIAVEHFFGLGLHKSTFIDAFVRNDTVSLILGILMLLNVIGVPVVMSTLLEISRKANKIDILDDAIYDMYSAKRKYEIATEELASKEKVNDAEILEAVKKYVMVRK